MELPKEIPRFRIREPAFPIDVFIEGNPRPFVVAGVPSGKLFPRQCQFGFSVCHNGPHCAPFLPPVTSPNPSAPLVSSSSTARIPLPYAPALICNYSMPSAFPPAPALSPASLPESPSSRPKRRGSTVKPLKRGRPSKRAKVGRLNWFNRLIRSGQLEEAARWHKRAGLSRYGIPLPALPAPPPPAASPASPATPTATTGGAGGSQRHGRENWDKTTPLVQNLQCSPLATADAVPLAVEADLTRLAAKADYTPTVTPPAGESEGERGFGQAESRSGADNVGVTDKIVSVWPKGGEGIVGKLCRNKQYNELRVVGEKGELWTKVGNWQFTGGLVRGERVLVARIWLSGDDTDAEYEVVRRIDVNEDVPQVPTVVDPIGVESAPIEAVAVPASAVSKQETPVAILPQFQREEPDYPRKQESAEDYIARIRAEAAMWANGQGR